MPIKSFRGKIKHEEVQTVPLSTNNGAKGYRIKNFQIIVSDPFVAQVKGVVKIYTIPQTAPGNAVVDFSDNTLLGVATYHDQPTAEDMSESTTIIFDNMVFNQDIYITATDLGANAKSFSYYIELESMPLSLDENTVATLKDIRNIASQ